MSQHRHSAVKFNTVTGGSAVTFGRVENLDVQGEPQRTRHRFAGDVIADQTVVDAVNPQFKFNVMDIEELAKLLCVPYGNTVADVDLFMRDVGAVSPVAIATATHKNYDVPIGYVYWTSIDFSSRQDVKASVVLDALFDPTGVPTTPFSVVETVAIPAVTAGLKIFTLGRVQLNGTDIPRVQSVNITNELQFEQDDDILRTVYKERAVVNDGTIRIRVKTKERFNWLAAGFGFNGTALNGSTGLTVWARRKNFAESALEHTRIRASTGVVYPVNAQGTGSQLMVDEFVAELLLPASGSILAFTSGLAVS